MPWYEEQLQAHGETDVDLSPCYDDAGDWTPTENCGGYTLDVAGPYGSWVDGCSEGAPLSGPSATCGPPLDGEPPEVAIASPQGDAEFEVGDVVQVSVDADDNVGIASVELFVDGVSVSTSDAEPYEWEVDDLGVGAHTLSATATDLGDNQAMSDEIEIEVVEADGDDDDADDDDDDDDDSDSDSDGDDDDDDDDDDDADDDDSDSDSDSDSDGDGDGDASSDEPGDGGSPGDDPGMDEADVDGCGCRVLTGGPANWLWALALVFLAGRRRRC